MMHVSTLIMVFFCMATLTGCSGKSPTEVQRKIEKGYGFSLPFPLTKQMIYADEWGYIILELPTSELKKILSKPVPNFSDWKPYKQARLIGYSKSFDIDGINNDHYMVAWNHSPTKHKCDKLAIFVDLSRNLLIFYDGIISGY